jgi:hypothetical protein
MGIYIAIAAALAIVAAVVFVPYRPVPPEKYTRVRRGAFLLLAVPVGWAAVVVFELSRGEPFLRDLIMAAATAVAAIYFLARVLLQEKPEKSLM